MECLDQSNEGFTGFHNGRIAKQAENGSEMGERLIKVRNQDIRESLKLHHSHAKVFFEPVVVQHHSNKITKLPVSSIPTKGVPKSSSSLLEDFIVQSGQNRTR